MSRDVSCESRSGNRAGTGVTDPVATDVEERQLREPLGNRAGAGLADLVVPDVEGRQLREPLGNGPRIVSRER